MNGVPLDGLSKEPALHDLFGKLAANGFEVDVAGMQPEAVADRWAPVEHDALQLRRLAALGLSQLTGEHIHHGLREGQAAGR